MFHEEMEYMYKVFCYLIFLYFLILFSKQLDYTFFDVIHNLEILKRYDLSKNILHLRKLKENICLSQELKKYVCSLHIHVSLILLEILIYL